MDSRSCSVPLAAAVQRAFIRALDWLRLRPATHIFSKSAESRPQRRDKESPSETALRHWKKTASYVAEAGLAAFTATAALTAVLTVLELRFSGFASPYVSPKTLVIILLVSGALALCGPETRVSRNSRLAWAVVGAILAACAFSAAWYHFSPVAGRFWIALGAALAAGLPAWIFGLEAAK